MKDVLALGESWSPPMSKEFPVVGSSILLSEPSLLALREVRRPKYVAIWYFTCTGETNVNGRHGCEEPPSGEQSAASRLIG